MADKDALKAGVVTLTKAQADAALTALERATMQEVKPTPKVSVGSGMPGRFGIGQELRYPVGWEKAAGAKGGWLATGVATKNLGVMMEVMPRVATDGSVQLEASVETTELAGFVMHEAPGEGTTVTEEFFAVNEPGKAGAAPVAINMGPHAEPFAEPVFTVHMAKGAGRVVEGEVLVLCGEIPRGSAGADTLLVFLTATASATGR